MNFSLSSFWAVDLTKVLTKGFSSRRRPYTLKSFVLTIWCSSDLSNYSYSLSYIYIFSYMYNEGKAAISTEVSFDLSPCIKLRSFFEPVKCDPYLSSSGSNATIGLSLASSVSFY